MDPKQKEILQTNVISFYKEEGRTFPWRETHDPYKIVVSELMLQQTQTSRVLPKYLAFLERFPTWEKLAEAQQAEVMRYWQGLGYNSRARRLHMLAQAVVSQYDGKLPRSAEELLALPGIGPYTVGAVLVFAFQKPHAFYDVNIKRVVSRFLFPPHEVQRLKEKEIGEYVEEVSPDHDVYAYYQGLMDIGAQFCLAREAKCYACPLQDKCVSKKYVDDDPTIFRQVRSKKVSTPFKDTKRFRRGRIMDILREAHKPLREQALYAKYVEVVGEEKDVFDVILNELVVEQLLQKRGETYCL